jgi:hypothetical protein
MLRSTRAARVLEGEELYFSEKPFVIHGSKAVVEHLIDGHQSVPDVQVENCTVEWCK